MQSAFQDRVPYWSLEIVEKDIPFPFYVNFKEFLANNTEK